MKPVLEAKPYRETNPRTEVNRSAILSDSLTDVIKRSCKKIAPLWPLKNFVAVNPFLGFSEKTFHETCATIHRINRVKILMPKDFYREALRSGAIGDDDLTEALKNAPPHWGLPKSLIDLKILISLDSFKKVKPKAVVATIAEVLDRLASGNRQVSRTSFMVDEISKFCSSYYDEGQALLPFPARNQSLYSAWLSSQRFDRNAEIMGIEGFRKTISGMPKDAAEAISLVVQKLGIPKRAQEDYLYRALFDISGWASYVRHLVWTNELNGKKDNSLIELLAIRVVWGYALFLERTDRELVEAWKSAMEDAAKIPEDSALSGDADFALEVILYQFT